MRFVSIGWIALAVALAAPSCPPPPLPGPPKPWPPAHPETRTYQSSCGPAPIQTCQSAADCTRYGPCIASDCVRNACVYTPSAANGCTCVPNACGPDGQQVCECGWDPAHQTVIYSHLEKCPSDYPVCGQGGCLCLSGMTRCASASALQTCVNGSWEDQPCPPEAPKCANGACLCDPRAGTSCSHCGTWQCDGTCSQADPPNYGAKCGCGDTGTIACDGTCAGAATPETDAAFCARLHKNCGAVTAPDNCGSPRTVTCGTCSSTQVCLNGTCQCDPKAGTACSHCGTWQCNGTCSKVDPPNYDAACGCGGTGKIACDGTTCAGAAAPWTDAEFCRQVGRVCGSYTGRDNCGTARRVPSCGTCASTTPVCNTAGQCVECSPPQTSCVSGTMRRCDNQSWTTVGSCAGSFAFSYSNPLPGWRCLATWEPADPNGWKDNYFCTTSGDDLEFSFSGPRSGKLCTKIYEECEPPSHSWDSNYLCVLPTSDLRFTWSQAGPVAGLSCVSWNEPADPDCWADNYLCWRRVTPPPPSKCDPAVCKGSCCTSPRVCHRECIGDDCKCLPD